MPPRSAPGPTSCITVALAPTVAPSCKVIGPITTAPAPTRTRSPSVGLPLASCPMVTCWLIQQWLPMDSAVTMVATPCWMKSPGPIRSASRVRVAAGRYSARSRRRSNRGRSAGGSGRACGTRSRRRSGMRIASMRSSSSSVCVVDAAHPPVDVLGDRIGRFRADDAAPQRIRPHPCQRQEHRPPVTRHGPIVETATASSRSTTWLQHRPHVANGLVDVLEAHLGDRYVGRARHHHQVTVEALLQDEPGPGDVRPERDDDDRPPPVCAPPADAVPALRLSSSADRDKAVQVERGCGVGAKARSAMGRSARSDSTPRRRRPALRGRGRSRRGTGHSAGPPRMRIASAWRSGSICGRT